MLIIGVILIVLGVLSIIMPNVMFAFRKGGRRRQVAHAAPTGRALVMMRVGGVVEVLVGLLLVFIAL